MLLRMEQNNSARRGGFYGLSIRFEIHVGTACSEPGVAH